MIIIHNPTAAWGGKKTHWQADRSCSCLRSYWALNKSNGLFGFCLTCYSLLQKFKSIRFFRAATCLACLDQFFFGKQSIHWARLLYIFKWWSLFCWCTNFLYSKECDLNRNAISHIENMLRDMASTLNSRGAPELRKLASTCTIARYLTYLKPWRFWLPHLDFQARMWCRHFWSWKAGKTIKNNSFMHELHRKGHVIASCWCIFKAPMFGLMRCRSFFHTNMICPPGPRPGFALLAESFAERWWPCPQKNAAFLALPVISFQ